MTHPLVNHPTPTAFTAPLEFEPGERWEYSIGIDWVGKLDEAALKH